MENTIYVSVRFLPGKPVLGTPIQERDFNTGN